MQLLETVKGKLYVGSKEDALRMMARRERIVFDIIWNLAEEFEFLREQESKYAKLVICEEIVDYSIPQNLDRFNTNLNTVLAALQEGKKVFVHCFAGHGRTGMVSAIILSRINQLPIQETLEIAQQLCHGPETRHQVEFVLGFK